MNTRGRVRLVEGPGLRWFEAEALSVTGLVGHAFSTRQGAVDELLAAVGLGGHALATVRQVHSDRLVVVEGASDVASAACTEADGLLTRSSRVALAVWTADCVPVLLLDPRRRAVAAVHSGWRGTSRRITGQAVRRMAAEFGSAPEDLLAAVGPSIGPCCYEVDEPVLARMAAAYPGVFEEFTRPQGEGRALLDLRAAVVRDLKETGVPGENVTVVEECTACRPDWFFSYRRDGRDAGRLAAVIGLREGTACLEGKGCPEGTGAGEGR